MKPRRCYACKLTKPLDSFVKNKSKSTGYSYLCKACSGDERRRYRHDARGNVAEYERLQSEQQGKCAICKKADKRKLSLDHCHKTQQIRGLLCSRCNLTIGLMDDSPALLKGAAEYLQSSL